MKNLITANKIPLLIEANTLLFISAVNAYCTDINILSAKTTCASCILSTATLLLLTPTDRVLRHQRFRFTPCQGLTIGSTLVPLYLSSISGFICRESGAVHNYIEAMAFLGCASSFAYALGSFIWILQREESTLKSEEKLLISMESYAIYVSGSVTSVVLVVTLLVMYCSSDDIDQNQQTCQNTRAAYLFSGCTYAVMHFISCALMSGKNIDIRLPFTSGEFIACLTLSEMLMSDFVVRYLVPFAFPSMTFLEPAHSYFAVSHGGIVGCFAGTIACYRLSRKAFVRSYCWMYQLIVVCVLAILCVEITLANEKMSENQSYHDQIIPASVAWIIGFLIIPAGTSETRGSTWLVYWASIIISSFPISLMIAKRLKKTTSILSTVIGRKYFHLIAIILFVPVTSLSPSMMCLSYAVALSLLIILELVRTSNMSKKAIEQSADSSKRKTARFYLSTIKALNSFFDAFFDEKDCGSDFVASHAALIFGCALPLWTCNALLEYFPAETSSNVTKIFSLLGVVVIGVGDSFGAVVGSLFGRTRWPGTKRTFEGSFSMLFSMMICFGLFTTDLGDLKVIMIICLLLTILEAVTTQIDNFCLPLAGSAILLIFH
mmetsp:Transcript_9119/g.13491  ORF Transcript_9119/g.13491 Transcript_9119/m.13491 type:complete len:605 (-) Transcript_9119:561-2375(-)